MIGYGKLLYWKSLLEFLNSYAKLGVLSVRILLLLSFPSLAIMQLESRQIYVVLKEIVRDIMSERFSEFL